MKNGAVRGAVVSVQTIAVKNRIAIHYCSFDRVVHLQTNTINLRILPYKCIVMRKYSTSFTDIPYKVGMVNHATKKRITDIPYKACTVNHATKMKQLVLLTFHKRLVRSTMPRRMKWQNY